MNAATAKYAKWYVRIIDPRVVPYSFMAKNERVQAQKFQCVLVSKDPSQYMLGLVPFDFTNRNAAVDASKRFTANTVWEITTPAFDTKAKQDFIGCPLKTVVLLSKPTGTKQAPPTNRAEFDHPATGLQVSLTIQGIMEHLKQQIGRRSQVFDFSGKFLKIEAPKTVNTKGQQTTVSDSEFVDQSGVRSWLAYGRARATFSLSCGQGQAWQRSDAVLLW